MTKTRTRTAVRSPADGEDNDRSQGQDEIRRRSPLRGTRPKPTVILRKVNRSRLQFTLTPKEMRKYELMEAREKKRIEKFKRDTNDAIAFLLTNLIMENKFQEIRRNIESVEE